MADTKILLDDIVDAVAKKRPGYVKSGVKALVKDTIEALADAISSGQEIDLRGLGIFLPTFIRERKMKNNFSGEYYDAPAYRGVKFHVSVGIKKKLAKLPKTAEDTASAVIENEESGDESANNPTTDAT